ncbi:hypothetical protein B9479_008256 [Cryptococcus floricola]|uniref:Uncharacterized protein n=1 Tax=Cryptococcus floricola TaxID=2591691 RepID=A0A5D3ALC3_9TREE|nr:hypothetical protein B9479_008256 [Cryptococcus floricola]
MGQAVNTPRSAPSDTLSSSKARPVARTPISAPTPLPIAPAPKRYQKKPKHKKIDGLLSYATSFIPGTYNVKIPAGDYLQKETNVDVATQISVERAKRAQEEEKAQREEAGIAQQVNTSCP